MHLLTKYEVTRVLGMRCLQLQEKEANARRRSIRELLDGQSPFTIRRALPDGTVEDVAVATAIVPEYLREELEYVLSCMA